jgi:beta-N-acetylhexosaminidase
VTDALDMRALAQGAGQVVDAVTALRNGEDLLLGTADPLQLRRLDEGLAQAEERGLLDGPTTEAARLRLAGLRRWLAGFDQPSLDVVGCPDHQALAAELARRSITLVRNDDGLLPLRLAADARVAVVQTRSANLTPADTSAGGVPTFAAALRRRLPNVEEFLLPAQPGIEDIGGIGSAVAAFDLVVVGTQSANLQPIQAALAEAVLGAGKPTITVALRTPWDLPSYPTARTHVATYGILPPSMEALAAALVGEAPFVGRLPVEIGGFYPRGHGAGPWA